MSVPASGSVTAPRELAPSDPPDEFDPGWAGLGAALPAGAAMLCVTGSGSADRPGLSMTWHQARNVQSASNRPELPELGLSLARLMKEAEAAPAPARGEGPWEGAYYEVRSWWHHQSTLVRWIRDLFSAGPRPRLVIWDNTAHNIPWELFYHQPSAQSGGPEGWLGELVPVVRWTSVHDGDRVAGYSAAEHVNTGGLLMLEEESLARPTDAFAEYLVEPPHRTVDTFMRRLDRPEDGPFGLVMIRCHGFYSPSGREFSIGGPSLNRLAGYPMKTLRAFTPPVVLNSCSSGQAIEDDRLPDRPVRSFVELFLRQGASAVVAVIGDIDSDHSHEFATRLLRTATDRPVNLAEALREHRRYYYQRIEREPSGSDTPDPEQDYKRFLTSFLYVYYGHPDTTLHLTPPGCGGPEGDGTGGPEEGTAR
ncbi:CHAT domain-containing protein [Kitasatospora phosalacinea]|uniref:CHAT domain-containing protein n=1 Tax=Kitasatospora phosalacinea TaxID=2065 RepID=UPI0036655807